MEKEISSGTMLGIVLIALAAVIGLGFGVFSIAKGVANEGTVGVQDNLGSVSESSFDDYNDKIVTGTMVKSAVNNFKGKSVAILINTTAMDKEVVTYKEHVSSYVWTLTNNKDGQTSSLSMVGGQQKMEKPDGDTHYYINYNALLGEYNEKKEVEVVTTDEDGNKKTETKEVTGVMKPAESKIELKDGIYTATGLPFAVDPGTGKVLFDYSTGGMSRTGNCEYLNATAKFDANLIKDDVGTTIGIIFTQRAQ